MTEDMIDIIFPVWAYDNKWRFNTVKRGWYHDDNPTQIVDFNRLYRTYYIKNKLFEIENVNMDKEFVAKYLVEIGFIKTEQREKNYDLYVNGEKNVWLGNWFVENEFDAVAFPFKDPISTFAELKEYIAYED